MTTLLPEKLPAYSIKKFIELIHLNSKLITTVSDREKSDWFWGKNSVIFDDRFTDHEWWITQKENYKIRILI